ncbi:MAG: MFS transporter [Mycobacteriales bacterium]
MSEQAEAAPEPRALRTLIPTERQRDVGDAGDYRDVDAAPATPIAEPTPPRLLTRLITDLDPRELEGPKLVLLILCLISLFARIDDAALGVLLPQIRAEFGISLTFLSGLSAVVTVLYIAMAIPMGYLADRVRRVWMLRIGTIATAAGITAQGAVGSVGGLAGARLATGVATGVAPPASFPLMADWFPPGSRARVFGIYFAAAQLGLIVGPLTAGLLGDAYGWRATLLTLGGLATVVALLTFFLREPIRGAFERPDATTTEAPSPPGFLEAYRAAASVATLRRLWYATPLLATRGALTFLVLPAFLSEVYGLTATQLGLISTIAGVTGFVGILAAGIVGDRILANRPGRFMVFMGLAPVIQCLALLVVSLRPPLVLAVAVLQLVIIFESVLQPAFYTLITFVVPARIRGLGLATAAPWALIGAVITPPLVVIAERVGLQRGILVFVPVLLLGGLVLGTGASGVERDIRAARAADAAAEAGRLSAEAGTSTLLVCRDVDVEYSGVQVLFGVDLDVARGEIVALVGTNGAGKSTMLRAISGAQEASNGAIFLDGRDITHLPPHQNAALGVVTMPGGAAVFPSLSVAENLRAAAWTLQDDPEAVAARTEEVLTLFPVLRERADQQAGSLSGGEQQMVGISQALLMAPTLLMVDELSLGLAPKVVEQLLDVLRILNARGTTIILVEQSLNVALTIANRAVFMEKGTVRFSGPTEELLRRPDLVRSVFMGGASGGTRGTARRPYVAPDSVTPPALQVGNISVRFGGINALSGVDLSVLPGQVVGIIGPNGAGKTTLFDVISGFVRPDSGTVSLAGTDVSGSAADTRARLGLGRSFQNARLFPALTVRENIAVALERRTVKNPVLGAVWAPQVRSSERRIRKQVERLVDLLGLTSYADKVLGELSTGSRRAVDVACIIALEPSILLLDEPSSGLAQAETEALGPLLTRIVKETGCGMLVIEHDIPLVTSLSDQLVAMESGRVLLSGNPTEVQQDPRVLASYLAASDDVISRSGNRMAALADILNSDTTKER